MVDDVESVHRPCAPYNQFEVNKAKGKYGRTFETRYLYGHLDKPILRHCCLEDG